MANDLNGMENKEIVKNWIKLQRLPHPSKEAESMTWVLIEMDELLYDKPTQYFDFILEVLKQTDDEWVLTNLAAGPLEDLLSQQSTVAMVLLEKEIPRNPKLKNILKDVWQNLMSEETWKRLQRLKIFS